MAGFRMTTNIPTLQEIEKVVTADVAAVEEAAMDEKERYLIDLSKEYTSLIFLSSPMVQEFWRVVILRQLKQSPRAENHLFAPFLQVSY